MSLPFMDFSYSLGQEIGSNPDSEFKGFEGDDADDEYFAELRSRILQLMADDDEDDDRFLGPKSSGASYPYKENLNLFSPPVLKPGIHFNRVQYKGVVSFPTTGSNQKIGAGLGTGVFIPIANPRSRIRSGRTNNQKRGMYRRVDNKQE